MSITDFMGDMLTIIRNANRVGFTEVRIPYSKMTEAVVNVLAKEGFIRSVEKIKKDETDKAALKINLKYGPNGDKVLHELTRISKPGRRVYIPKNKIPRVKNGFGMLVLTTSKGILSSKEARLQNVGGEVICRVW